jgi:hypothetical protein
MVSAAEGVFCCFAVTLFSFLGLVSATTLEDYARGLHRVCSCCILAPTPFLAA